MTEPFGCGTDLHTGRQKVRAVAMAQSSNWAAQPHASILVEYTRYHSRLKCTPRVGVLTGLSSASLQLCLSRIRFPSRQPALPVYNWANEEPAIAFNIVVNEIAFSITASADTPLLYVLTNDLHLQGPRFGCGLGQCGGCSVLVNDVEMRSCILPVSAVNGKSITTLEGLPKWYAKKKGRNSPGDLHPVQQAMIDEQAVQCGYCYNGMGIKASELLAKNSRPAEAEIRKAMRGHLCRCGIPES